MMKRTILLGVGILSAWLSPSPAARADFTVHDVTSTGSVQSLADAEALLAGSGVAHQTTTSAGVINYTDEGSVGRFGGDSWFPDSVAIGASRDNFALRATATIAIDAAGTYTFGTNADDGVHLRIDSGGGLADVIVDDRIHGYEDHFGVVTFASAGSYSLELVFFEGWGQAAVELFAARGSFRSFGDTDTWRLVGDSANGGISTVGQAAVPEPASLAMLALGGVGVGLVSRRGRRSA